MPFDCSQTISRMPASIELSLKLLSVLLFFVCLDVKLYIALLIQKWRVSTNAQNICVIILSGTELIIVKKAVTLKNIKIALN